MRALAVLILATGLFAGVGKIAHTVFSPEPLTPISDRKTEPVVPETTADDSVPTDTRPTVTNAVIRIAPGDLASSQPSVDTKGLLEGLPDSNVSLSPKMTASAARTRSASGTTRRTNGAGTEIDPFPDVTANDLVKLAEAVNRSAVFEGAGATSGISQFALTTRTAAGSSGRGVGSMAQSTGARRGGGAMAGGGGLSPGALGSNRTESGGILQAITAPATDTTVATAVTVPDPGLTLVAGNTTPTGTTKDYSKFGIQNAQFWAFDFSAGDAENGDINGDGIIDALDARIQFDAYLDYLQQELDDPEQLQVVRNNVDDLSQIFDEFNAEAALKQDPDLTDAISENFVSYMIIEFDTKGFYLPNNQKFQDQVAGSNAWQFNANPDPGLNP